MLWENCFVGLFWYIINCIGPLWYYRVLVATVVLLRSLAAVITNNGQGAKTAACGQINVLMVGLKISYQLVSLLWCQHLYSVKISQRLLNRRPGGTQGSDLSHCWLIKSPSLASCRGRLVIFTPGQSQHLHNMWSQLPVTRASRAAFLWNLKLPALGICLLDCQINRLETWKSGVNPDNALL